MGANVYELIDNETDEVINEIVVENDDELIELGEMSEALGFRIERIR